uniref:Uncharacterized protein n=1 Tax=Ditylenchus dipsaci TaxID=166011 RepID=A0A915DI74_9BILA
MVSKNTSNQKQASTATVPRLIPRKQVPRLGSLTRSGRKTNSWTGTCRIGSSPSGNPSPSVGRPPSPTTLKWQDLLSQNPPGCVNPPPTAQAEARAPPVSRLHFNVMSSMPHNRPRTWEELQIRYREHPEAFHAGKCQSTTSRSSTVDGGKSMNGWCREMGLGTEGCLSHNKARMSWIGSVTP